MKDYYRILEVHPDASAEVITKAYKTLARKYHPDQFHVSDKRLLTERMQDLNAAYETLGDPHLRARYDREYKRYAADAPTREKSQRWTGSVKKIIYAFLVTILLAMMIRDGVTALLMMPVVRLMLAVLVIGFVLQRWINRRSGGSQ